MTPFWKVIFIGNALISASDSIQAFWTWGHLGDMHLSWGIDAATMAIACILCLFYPPKFTLPEPPK